MVNCKFMINDFGTGQNILYVSGPVVSGSFYAYGSYSKDFDYSNYYITQASSTITISELQIPPIANIEFTSESYTERLANINENITLDLLLDPSTT